MSRSAILSRAALLVSTDRSKQYGDAAVNMSCAANLKEVVRAHRTRSMSPEEVEAIDMCLTKISRIVTGPTPHEDNYTDLAGYAAIAGEFATREPEA